MQLASFMLLPSTDHSVSLPADLLLGKPQRWLPIERPDISFLLHPSITYALSTYSRPYYTYPHLPPLESGLDVIKMKAAAKSEMSMEPWAKSNHCRSDSEPRMLHEADYARDPMPVDSRNFDIYA